MADSRIEEVQAKVTELQTQYEKVLSELDVAIAAYAGENSAENASKLATAQKAEEEAKNELEGAKQQVEIVKQDVLAEVVEAELDKAEIDLASKNIELEKAEEAAKGFNIPTFLRTPRTEKPLREYRKEAMEAEAIKDLWEAQSEVVKAAQETLNAEIAAHINDESYTPQTSETQAVDAAREAEKRAKELLDEAKRKYQKLTGKDYPIDEIISQALGDIEPQRGVGSKAQDNLKQVMGNKASRSASADVQKDWNKELDDLVNRSKEELKERAQEATAATTIEIPSFTRETNGESTEDASKRIVEEYNKSSEERKQGFKGRTEEFIKRKESLKVSYPKYIKKDTPEMIATREKIAEAEEKLRQAQQKLKKVEKRIESIGKNSVLFTPEVQQSLEDAKKQVKVHEVAVGKLKYELRQLESAQVMRWLEEIKKINGEVTSSRNQREEGAEGNTKSSEEPSNTPPSEVEVLPFMNNHSKTTRRPRVTPINKQDIPRGGEAEWQGEEPVSNQGENRESGENGQSQAPREMSEKSKEKIAMLTNLRRALTQLDVAAQTAIQMVIDRAEVAKNDPNETLKVSDVSALKEVLAKMDEIVYSPEVANAAADASQAYQMNILIGNLRRKIQKNIQKSIVENYHDLNIENDLAYFYNGNNPNDPARNGSSMNVEGFFGDFVKRNLDNSRLRYEEMQLRTMKRGLAYAKTANNPQYEGFGHVFGELNNACVDKANIDLVFQKAAEYTPEKIQSMMDALQTQQFSPEQIEEVFKAVSEYTKALEDIEKSFKENSQLVGEKRKVIEEIINGNNEFDKNVAPELQGVVRALAFQTLYAHTLDDYEGVKGKMIKSLDNHGKTDFSTMMKMLGNVKKFNSSPNRAEILARQRDKALLGKILFDIPFLKESVGQVVPGFHTALHQFEMSDEAPEPVDNLYAWLAMTVKQYQDGKFNQKIADLEAYAIGYSKANQNASRLSPDGTRPLNGDELFDAMIKEQEDAVKREKDLIERKEKYIERSDKIKGEGVEQSSSELDIEKLGKKLGVDNLKGKVALPSNQENESGSNNQTVRTALQEQQILNELSEANYLALRINAIAELNKKNPQALIPRGLLIKRFAIFLVNSIGRMLGVRNIPTKSEKAINQYIKNNYISEMLKENDRIQSELSAVKAEEEAIKSEEISLKDRNRKKISERDKLLNKEKAKDKGAQTKAAPSQGEPSK